MKNEIWLPIKGYNGVYIISNYGNVFNTLTGNTIKGDLNNCGYRRVKLCMDGVEKRYFVHRLVICAFIPNILGYEFVNHIDENKLNNFVGTPEKNFEDGNLEWCDAKYNANHGTRIKRISNKQKNGKHSKPVLQYTLDGDLIREWPSIKEINRSLGYADSNISLCCRNIYKQAYGYLWRFKDIGIN